jgi:hypothetical protein
VGKEGSEQSTEELKRGERTSLHLKNVQPRHNLVVGKNALLHRQRTTLNGRVRLAVSVLRVEGPLNNVVVLHRARKRGRRESRISFVKKRGKESKEEQTNLVVRNGDTVVDNVTDGARLLTHSSLLSSRLRNGGSNLLVEFDLLRLEVVGVLLGL